jgi:hypothetical protein
MPMYNVTIQGGTFPIEADNEDDALEEAASIARNDAIVELAEEDDDDDDDEKDNT